MMKTDKTRLNPTVHESIDFNYGLTQVGGSKAFYQELLHDFVTEYGNIGAEIETFLVAGNGQEARRLLHGLTGVAGNLGVRNLYQIATELTEALRQEQPWRSVLERLKTEMDQIIRNIEILVDFKEDEES